jgi:hypothetical protein
MGVVVVRGSGDIGSAVGHWRAPSILAPPLYPPRAPMRSFLPLLSVSAHRTRAPFL